MTDPAIPCNHLDGESCALGRHFPADCHGCAAYQPSLTPEERTPNQPRKLNGKRRGRNG